MAGVAAVLLEVTAPMLAAGSSTASSTASGEDILFASKARPCINIIFRGSFLLSCLGQLVTGVSTSEADIMALLGCSASDWEEVRSEAREEGRVSVTRSRRQVS